MTDKPIPRCPMGHEMALIQIAAGGWRYGCIHCATSFKARKSTSCGWLSPIKSTKERALEAAMKHPLQKPLTLEEVVNPRNTDNYGVGALWCEYRVSGDLMIALFSHGHLLEHDERLWLEISHDKYNRYFRCWAQKPTDEERAAAKWEEADHE